jgi:hypothetical protein
MATLSGQATVAAAGTAVVLGTQEINGPIRIHAPSANTGVIYIGNVDGDVDSATGVELAGGESFRIDFIRNLGVVWVDAATSGDKANWCMMEMVE